MALYLTRAFCAIRRQHYLQSHGGKISGYLGPRTVSTRVDGHIGGWQCCKKLKTEKKVFGDWLLFSAKCPAYCVWKMVCPASTVIHGAGE